MRSHVLVYVIISLNFVSMWLVGARGAGLAILTHELLHYPYKDMGVGIVMFSTRGLNNSKMTK